MKIRKGFVSNSSSASFIIALPEEPYSFDHLKQMLFPHAFCNKEGGFSGSTVAGEFLASYDQITGFIYGQVCKRDNYYEPDSDPINMTRLFWFKSYEEREDIDCEKYQQWSKDGKRGKCKKTCPRILDCRDKIGISDGQRMAIDWMDNFSQMERAVAAAKKFTYNTLGYHYYLIDCGCQTKIGYFLSANHDKVFKNIHHVALGDL